VMRAREVSLVRFETHASCKTTPLSMGVPSNQMETTMTQSTTTYNSVEMLEMFVDETSDEIYASGRLCTVERGESTLLVAYGEKVIARATGRTIDLFTGHHSNGSRSVTNYIKRLGSVLNDFENRDVHEYEDLNPTLGPNSEVEDSSQYIGHYVNFTTDFSAVERDAVDEVESALMERMEQIFG